jgi:putative transposase
MPRTARASVGGVCYHVINRGNGRAEVFHKDDDYAAFVRLIAEAGDRFGMRLLSYCLMPNHFHLVPYPRHDGDLSRWMQWLLTAHVRRYHRHYGTSGHVWQGRFKAFPIQQNEHLLTVMRYVERNPLRAGLVARAEAWPWSSMPCWRRRERPSFLHSGPVDRGRHWIADVNHPMTDEELEGVRKSVNRGTPWGAPAWQRQTATRLGLESALRPRGRPRKRPAKRHARSKK